MDELPTNEARSPRGSRLRIGAIALLCALAVFGIVSWRTRQMADLNGRLVDAVRRTDLAATRAALADGADPNARVRDSEGITRSGHASFAGVSGERKPATALMLASSLSLDLARELVEKGADVRASGCEHGDWDPAMHALVAGRMDVLRYLLDKGADANHHDRVGTCALSMAATRGNAEALALLLDYNAVPNGEDLSGLTPVIHVLMHAPVESRARCLRILLDHNAYPDYGAHGMTPLMAAILQNSPECVEELLRHHANVQSIYPAFRTPLKVAREKGCKKIEAMLLRAGAVEGDAAEKARKSHQPAAGQRAPHA